MTTVDLPRPDVPAPIALVRDFVNTTDHETGTDDLTTRAALVRHLTGSGAAHRRRAGERRRPRRGAAAACRPASGTGAEPRR